MLHTVAEKNFFRLNSLSELIQLVQRLLSRSKLNDFELLAEDSLVFSLVGGLKFKFWNFWSKKVKKITKETFFSNLNGWILKNLITENLDENFLLTERSSKRWSAWRSSGRFQRRWSMIRASGGKVNHQSESWIGHQVRRWPATNHTRLPAASCWRPTNQRRRFKRFSLVGNRRNKLIKSSATNPSAVICPTREFKSHGKFSRPGVDLMFKRQLKIPEAPCAQVLTFENPALNKRLLKRMLSDLNCSSRGYERTCRACRELAANFSWLESRERERVACEFGCFQRKSKTFRSVGFVWRCHKFKSHSLTRRD